MDWLDPLPLLLSVDGEYCVVGIDGSRGGIEGRLNLSWGDVRRRDRGGHAVDQQRTLGRLISVAQPPLPRVAPMLQATWWLPAVQLGSEIVL